MVADSILKDMLSAKSKITDVCLLVDENAAQLKELGLLDDFSDILYSVRYNDEQG